MVDGQGKGKARGGHSSNGQLGKGRGNVKDRTMEKVRGDKNCRMPSAYAAEAGSLRNGGGCHNMQPPLPTR